jgi:lycopene cyclase domain-containing protein
MRTGSLIYLVSIFVLTVPLIVDEWVIGRKKLRPYWKIVLALTAIGLIYGATEGLALKLKIWEFSKKSDTEIYILGSHIETYVINLLVFPIIGAATLLLIGLKHRVRRIRKR